MNPSSDQLERRYRQLLRSYPSVWRQRYEDEVVAVLLDQAEAAGRTGVTLGTVLDLVGHGAEERLESLLRWWPTRLRDQVAAVALVVGAALSLVMGVGEVIGAHFRPPLEVVPLDGWYFSSGPVLTIGVGLYLAVICAALLVALGHGGPARLLLLSAVAYAIWMALPAVSAGHPTPRPPILVLIGGLGLLGAMATIRLPPRAAHRLVGYGAALVAAVVCTTALTQPLLAWSVGTMATSGNVALAALATSLPVVVAASMLTSALINRRHPGWSAAIAVAALPVVLFCSTVSQAVNPAQAGPRGLIPLGYLLVVAAVALVDHRGRARRIVRG